MDFERRFSFHSTNEFPRPRSMTSIKRKKSFSEKIFKGAADSTLRLKKFMLMNKERVKNKELSERNNLFSGRVSPIELPTSESYDYFPYSTPRSDSIKSDSYIPLPSHSSTISLNNIKSLKSPSQHKLGTFKRKEPYSSPHRNLFKRFRKKNLEESLPSNDDVDSLYSSPLSYKLPLTPFLNTTFSPASNLNLDFSKMEDSKISFYGQVSSKKKLARTDYSCGVSPVYDKDLINKFSSSNLEFNIPKQSKHIESPKVNMSLSDDSFSSDSSSCTDVVNDDFNKSPLSITSVTSNNEFQRELLTKFSKLKKSDYNSSIDSITSNMEETFKSTAPQKRSPGKRNFFAESKLFKAQALKLNGSTSLECFVNGSVSPKPNLAPKPQTCFNNSDKPHVNKSNSSTLLASKEKIKPQVPAKPLNFKPLDNQIQEVNNNYIIISKDKDCYSTKINIPGKESFRPIKIDKSLSLEKLNKFRLENQNKVNNRNDFNAKPKIYSSSVSLRRNSNSLSVKDLAAAFDNF